MRDCSGTISEWLEDPSMNAVIILGREVGTLVFQSLQEVLIELLNVNACHAVHWVVPGSHIVYTTNRFHYLRSKCML